MHMIKKFLQRMVFSDGCRSWYKGGRADGKVIGIWPGRFLWLPLSSNDRFPQFQEADRTFHALRSSLHYYEMLSEPRFEDFDYVYNSENM